MSGLSRSSSARRSFSSLATCTSLSQAITSIDNSKPAVVFDIGRRLTKVGYAGDFVPRVIIRTPFLDASFCGSQGDVADIPQCIRTSLSNLVKFFGHIFNSDLLTMPRERRVVIVESLLTPTQFRELICEALMGVLNVPSVLFIPSHLCATYPFNTEYALVVDVGYMETLAVPIAEGVTMLSCWEVSNAGSRKLEDRVRELLRVHGRIEGVNGLREISEDDRKLIEVSRIIEDICVRFVFCAPFERGQAIQACGAEHGLPPIKSVRVPLGQDFLIVPGYVREAACEVFFERDSDDASIAQAIHSLVERCSIDLRRKMFQSILLIGGPSLIPGFQARLKAEIMDIAKSSPSKMKQCESIRFYRFSNQSPELYMGWLGGSMFCSLQDVVGLRSVSREAWLGEHILPDWTDYVQHRLPCGIPDVER